jgi:hypothetical protein
MARRKSKDSKLPITEELDFHYLLELMPPLHDEQEFALLPELFSIIGHERLLLLCRYAGGETVKIPTVEQLSESIEALQWFYDVYIMKKCSSQEIPKDLLNLVQRIYRVYSDEIGNDKNGN